MVSMSIVGSRVPNKNLQKTRTRTHRATKEKERGKRVGTREEEMEAKKTLGNVKTRVIPVGLTRRPPST